MPLDFNPHDLITTRNYGVTGQPHDIWTQLRRESPVHYVETESHPPFYCLLYTSPSPRDQRGSRMPSSA